jgi:hypothetical protein
VHSLRLGKLTFLTFRCVWPTLEIDSGACRAQAEARPSERSAIARAPRYSVGWKRSQPLKLRPQDRGVSRSRLNAVWGPQLMD